MQGWHPSLINIIKSCNYITKSAPLRCHRLARNRGCCVAIIRDPASSGLVGSSTLRVFHDHGALDVVEVRKLALQVAVPSLEHRILLAGADAAAGSFAILGVECVGHLDALDDVREWHERLGIERRAVVA